MSWVIRKKEDYFDPYMLYVADSSSFTIRIHHGGRIVGEKYKSYEGGDVDYVDCCDADEMSMFEINAMVKELGHNGPILYYYIDPTSDLTNGLRELQTDEQLLEFCEWVNRFKVMEVYCDHKTKQELEKIVRNAALSPFKKSGVVIEEIAEEVQPVKKQPRKVNVKRKLFTSKKRGTGKKDVLLLTASEPHLEDKETEIRSNSKGGENEGPLLFGDDQEVIKQGQQLEGGENEGPSLSGDGQQATKEGQQLKGARNDVQNEGPLLSADSQQAAKERSQLEGVGHETETGGGVTEEPRVCTDGTRTNNAVTEENSGEGGDNFSEQGGDNDSEHGGDFEAFTEFGIDEQMFEEEPETFLESQVVNKPNEGGTANRASPRDSMSTENDGGNYENSDAENERTNLDNSEGGVEINEANAAVRNSKQGGSNDGQKQKKQSRRRCEQGKHATGEEEDNGTLHEDNVNVELHSNPNSSDDEGCPVTYSNFNVQKDMSNPKFEIGMKFGTKKEFQVAVANYSIINGKDIVWYTNDSARLRAKCRDPCKWVVYASKESSLNSNDFVVKTLVDKHSECDRCHKNRYLTAEWISETVDEDYECEISKDVAYRARALAREKIKGRAEEQYALIWDYAEELKKTHPNSTIDIHYSAFMDLGCNPRFMCFYCCLGPLKKGFMSGCRPIVCLDSCHIKGPYPGHIHTNSHWCGSQ